ncbi:hypothetical protein [Corynebacterium sp.]|uniref:hypothetical protein n=1 Tax=Corynebacterium sp. TaxID=1720 RepID=UPI0028AAD561|nr:hypothetical protein [Corynebacterium sp.]
MFSRDGRKRPTPRRVVDPEAPDAMFPHLPRQRADLLREETMRYLHAEGFDTAWRPDGYIVATPAREQEGEEDGTAEQDAPPPQSRRLIGLDNLSPQIAAAPHAPVSEIIELIRYFLATVLTEIDVDALPDADFLRHLHVRLAARSALDAASGAVDDASRDFTGDLHVSLVLDTPDAIMTLNDEALAAHGTATREQLADLYRVGYRNTWQELHDAAVDINEVHGDVHGGSPGAYFHVVESDSFFLASAPLFLDELLPRWLPDMDVSAGVMVAVPHRHLMLVREVTTGQDLLDGINTMTSVALAQLATNPGPLTARLHLAHDGDVRVFTDISTGDDGQQILQVEPDDYLLSRLESEN